MTGRFVWGTVTGVSPLRVQLDGDTSPLPITPDSLIDPLSLAVGDRVRCELRRRLVVHGRAGGVLVGVWRSFTPTITGLTLGNGTAAFHYIVVGDWVYARYYVLFGSTTSMTAFTVTLPNGDSQQGASGSATLARGEFIDASTGEQIELRGARNNDATVQTRYLAPASSGTARVVSTPISGAAPVTPATGDEIRLIVMYRRA